MSYAYQVMPAAGQPARQLKITVRNSEGQLLEGTTIALIVGGQPVAQVNSSDGTALVTDPGLTGSIRVEAKLAGRSQSMEIHPGDTEIEILLPVFRHAQSSGPPEAHCLTTGQKGRPCVNCPVGGTVVRICC